MAKKEGYEMPASDPKVSAEGKPVVKNGGNAAIHDGIETNQDWRSASGPIDRPAIDH